MILGVLSIPLFGGNTIKVGTGGEKGNYFSMANDIFNNYCESNSTVEIIKTGGSVDNLTGIIQKKYSIGIVQSDVLLNVSKTDPTKVNMNSIKVIASLHEETVHLLIPIDYVPEKSDGSGLFSKFNSLFSNKDTKEITLSVLKDQKISSWGGSIVSAKALSYFFDLNWDVVPITEADAIKTRTPIILVGGAPYHPVEKILESGKWNIISINYEEIAAKAPFYIKSIVTYKINNNPISVNTISVQALLVGKSYSRSSRNEFSINTATCINNSLADLADDSDTNPNWSNVHENSKIPSKLNWPFFNTN
jgi:hypothetical protein